MEAERSQSEDHEAGVGRRSSVGGRERCVVVSLFDELDERPLCSAWAHNSDWRWSGSHSWARRLGDPRAERTWEGSSVLMIVAGASPHVAAVELDGMIVIAVVASVSDFAVSAGDSLVVLSDSTRANQRTILGMTMSVSLLGTHHE